MPRIARVDVGNHVYHVINRAVMRLEIFSTKEEFQLFEKLLASASEETGMRILAYVLMPNHWHLLLHTENDGDLGLFMHRLTNTHTRRVHSLTGTIGHGPIYQGRYKSFLIQNDVHLLTVLKYIERNPVRAGLSSRAEQWQWGSAWRRVRGTSSQKKLLVQLPVPIPEEYQAWINTPESSEELKNVRVSVNKGTPFGKESWQEKMTERFNLRSTLRNPGRPRK